MKFSLVDDLHLEFSTFHLPGDKEAILLLAGDILLADLSVFKKNKQASLKERFDSFFEEASKNYKQIYYIPGNHEYYDGLWGSTSLDLLRVKYGSISNCRVLEKEWVELDEQTVLYGATLWTDFAKGDPLTMLAATENMADYRYIKDREGHILPAAILKDHYEARDVLLDGLRKYRDKKIVVMTHHAPSFRSVQEFKYGGVENKVNFAFASELDWLMMDNTNIKYWVHGHMHHPCNYKIGETKVLCNPRGYSYKGNEHGENPEFNPSLSFEV